MGIALSDVLTHGEEQITAEVDGDVVMMSVEKGEYYGLDAIGSRIWALFEQPTSLNDAVDVLLGEFEVDRATCEQDVISFVEQLLDKGLLRRVDAA